MLAEHDVVIRARLIVFGDKGQIVTVQVRVVFELDRSPIRLAVALHIHELRSSHQNIRYPWGEEYTSGIGQRDAPRLFRRRGSLDRS